MSDPIKYQKSLTQPEQSIPVSPTTPLPVSLVGGGGTVAATIADGADVTQGAKADAQATDAVSAWSVVALLKGMLAQLLSTNPVQTFRSDIYAARITTNATTVVKNAPGTCVGFIVNAVGTTETVSVFDNLTGTGTAVCLFVLTGLAVGTRITMDLAFGTGITYVTAGGAACDITPIFR